MWNIGKIITLSEQDILKRCVQRLNISAWSAACGDILAWRSITMLATKHAIFCLRLGAWYRVRIIVLAMYSFTWLRVSCNHFIHLFVLQTITGIGPSLTIRILTSSYPRDSALVMSAGCCIEVTNIHRHTNIYSGELEIIYEYFGGIRGLVLSTVSAHNFWNISMENAWRSLIPLFISGILMCPATISQNVLYLYPSSRMEHRCISWNTDISILALIKFLDSITP